ncbi:aspartate dehydrogenase [Candidatus Bathyarchaeota archaeon]|nr:MAG: aspartate dehydrogenase [Candidatus Bathyarchaeota archaeon ex4484_40]RLG98550.1 MAG: aspartate dehydrogenase [Candidatus Bathyarchaeota archaeon]
MGVGLIGCGSIGTVIAKAIDGGKAGELELVAVYDIVREHAERLVKSLSKKPVIAETSSDLIKRRDINLIVEAASQDAVREYAVKALREGKDFMVMSTGALLDENLYQEVLNVAKRTGRKVYVPSGAVVGLDNVKSAALEEIESVTLTTRKPPVSFEGAPFIKERGVDLTSIREPKVLYEGPAREAVKLFPRNVNVAASLSLAGVGADRTWVKIIADPNVKGITHEVRVKGAFGELMTKTVNRPFPDNPKTSYIAALSAIATLKKVSENIDIGT